jgi:hypothetical protein
MTHRDGAWRRDTPLDGDASGRLLDLSGRATRWSIADLVVPEDRSVAVQSFGRALPGDFCALAEPTPHVVDGLEYVCHRTVLLLRKGRLVDEKVLGYVHVDEARRLPS